MSAATEVTVPDIGDFDDVPVIEVHVKPGDRVNEDDPVLTLESDKATMDVPSPLSGVVRDVPVKVGDHVSQGSVILHVEPGDGALAQPPSLVEQQEPESGGPQEAGTAPQAQTSVSEAPARPAPASAAPPSAAPSSAGTDFSQLHAGPSVRRL